MQRFKFLAALLLAFAPALGAQRGTAFELGVFLQYSKYDDFTGLKNGVGAGARLGAYLFHNFALEYEGDFTKTKSARLGHLTALNNRVDGIFYFPVGAKLRLLVGGGWTGTQYHSDTTKNQFDSGGNAVLGFKYCVNENWAFRADANADFKDPSDQTLEGQRTRTYNFRVGFSRFLGSHGKNSPCFEAEQAPQAPAPRPAPQPAAAAAPPPPPPAARVNLSASPSSIVAGQSSTLRWNATNATSCNAPWLTAGTTSGSQTVYPTTTTTYSVTCDGAGGSGSNSTTVTVSEPPPPPPPAPVPTPSPARARRELLSLHGAHFAFDKSDLTAVARDTLNTAVAILKEHPDSRIEIQGHTDWVGTDEYNQGLSERRANSVRDYLISQGISASRITTRGFGESQPVADNNTAAGRKENRRVVIIEIP